MPNKLSQAGAPLQLGGAIFLQLSWAGRHGMGQLSSVFQDHRVRGQIFGKLQGGGGISSAY